VRRGRGDVPRPGGGARTGGRDLPRAPAPVHASPAPLHPVDPGPGADQAAHHLRIHPAPAQPAARLPLPPALRGVDPGHVRAPRAGAPPPRAEAATPAGARAGA
jgi:hypothetical protein